MDYIIVFTSFTLSIWFLLLSQKYLVKRGITVKINNRSSHSVIATNNGGIAIFFVIFFISSVLYLLNIELYDYNILVPLSMITIVGIYDDLYDADFRLKLIFQIIIAKILLDNGFIIDNLHGILGIYALGNLISQVLTIFVIVAIINAINFIDGIDGLAVSCVLYFVIAYEFLGEDYGRFDYLTLLMTTSIIPLFYFNFRKKNKMFLGDSGSLFLGTIVSIYSLNILSSGYIIEPKYDINKVLYIFSILTYPIVDIIRVFFIRVLKGKSPFQADKNHIHHILNNKFNNHLKVVWLILSFTILTTIILQIILN